MRSLAEVKAYYNYLKRSEPEWAMDNPLIPKAIMENVKGVACPKCNKVIRMCDCPVYSPEDESHKTEIPIDYELITDDIPSERMEMRFGNLDRI